MQASGTELLVWNIQLALGQSTKCVVVSFIGDIPYLETLSTRNEGLFQAGNWDPLYNHFWGVEIGNKWTHPSVSGFGSFRVCEQSIPTFWGRGYWIMGWINLLLLMPFFWIVVPFQDAFWLGSVFLPHSAFKSQVPLFKLGRWPIWSLIAGLQVHTQRISIESTVVLIIHRCHPFIGPIIP